MEKWLKVIGWSILVLIVVLFVWSWLRPKTPRINDVFTPASKNNFIAPVQPLCEGCKP